MKKNSILNILKYKCLYNLYIYDLNNMISKIEKKEDFLELNM